MRPHPTSGASPADADPDAAERRERERTLPFAALPFLPLWLLAHGAVARKLAPD